MVTNTGTTGSLPTGKPAGRYRWLICALLFYATTVNYMDRSILGVLGPTLQYKVFLWKDTDFARINMIFKLAYAIGLLSMGAIIDRLGTRFGYTLSIAIWSIAGMLHAAVRPAFSLLGFSLARFGLGLGESGNFPAAIKTVGEWFPKKERAFATGIFNAGSNVGAILAPIVIPLVVWPDGTNWQYAFLTTGVFSAIWVVLWWKCYRPPELHPKVTKAELDYINSDSKAEVSKERLPWRRVLGLIETWAFAVAKITDAVWWFYLFWGGKFLYDRFGLSLSKLALPLVIIYVIADFGSVAGGWLSSAFLNRGWTVNRARKTTMLLCALCIMPVMFVTQIHTTFNFNPGFFQKLETATYTAEQYETVNGKVVRKKVEEHVSAEIQTPLRTLAGQGFATAKEFMGAVTKALAEAIATPRVEPVRAALLAATAGKTEIDADYLVKSKGVVPDDVQAALVTLQGKSYPSTDALIATLTQTLAKAKAGRVEPALIASARSDNMYWIAVLLMGLALGGHQAWSANIFTLVSDVFPKKATASVTGIGGMVGGLAGIAADYSLGQVLTDKGPAGYFYAFMLAGSAYLIILGIVHLMMPTMTPRNENLQYERS